MKMRTPLSHIRMNVRTYVKTCCCHHSGFFAHAQDITQQQNECHRRFHFSFNVNMRFHSSLLSTTKSKAAFLASLSSLLSLVQETNEVNHRSGENEESCHKPEKLSLGNTLPSHRLSPWIELSNLKTACSCEAALGSNTRPRASISRRMTILRMNELSTKIKLDSRYDVEWTNPLGKVLLVCL